MLTGVVFLICAILPTCVSLVEKSSWPSDISIGLINNLYHPLLYLLITNETVKDLKANGVVPNEVNFKFYETFGCDDSSSMDSAVKLWFNYNVSIIFGPECSTGAPPVCLTASSLNKPVIGYLQVTSDIANKTKFTTTARVSYTMSMLAKAVATTMVHHNWTIVAIIRSSTFISSDLALSGIPKEFKENNINIASDILVDFSSLESIKNAVQATKLRARIILICAGNMPIDALPFLKEAYEEDMMSSEYVYFTPIYARQYLVPWEPWMAANINSTYKAQLLAYYQNTIMIQTYGETTATFKQFIERITNIVDSDKATYAVTGFNNASMIRFALLHDAIYLYGLIINDSLSRGQGANLTGQRILSAASHYDFAGVTGRVVMDESGERMSNYYIMKLGKDNNYSPYMLLGATENDTSNLLVMQVLEYYQKPNWNTPDNLQPRAVPLCGFRDELCPKHTISIEALSICLSVCIVFAFAAISYIIYIRRKKAIERQILQLPWKIDIKDLQYIPKHITSVSLNSYSFNSKPMENDKNLNSSLYSRMQTDGKFEGCGFYKDTMVAIKRWKRFGNIMLHREHLLHLKTLKEMNHDNTNRFIGFSIDGGPNVMCVWLYCAKKSLQDIIYNEDIHLDATFQVSILHDIISGLEYIHSSPIGYHGRLFVSNCLVDSRWIVKLTDFGLQPILNEMKKQKAVELKDEERMNKMLCTAPELLRFPSLSINLKPADIYQYGMVIYQVLFREEPFADFDADAEDIVAKLKFGETKEVPLQRPRVKALKELDAKINNLFLYCWQENPSERPTVQDVKKEIFAGTKTFGKNLIDHVMSMLEKYATNLEKIVNERTQQYNEERKRADRLLCLMLPKSIANALKNGVPVQPEMYECVTIYFSDIVGFTTICGRSKPVEIVTMLNFLYSRFDEIILSFDAYKVETIGDAYLVVSGLPERNGDQHVTNIADMSLKILKTISKFVIPHLPEEQIKVRIGIHTGPVASGVVGLTMPKYCLFGDTVNVASRMESTGEAGKIHLTESTKLMLDSYTEYVTNQRGQIDVKGKGVYTTYWLLHKMSQ